MSEEVRLIVFNTLRKFITCMIGLIFNVAISLEVYWYCLQPSNIIQLSTLLPGLK